MNALSIIFLYYCQSLFYISKIDLKLIYYFYLKLFCSDLRILLLKEQTVDNKIAGIIK